jgi:hypothetical protein
LFRTPDFVISTEAAHSLIVNSAVERPPYFAVAVAFAFAVVVAFASRYPKASALGL